MEVKVDDGAKANILPLHTFRSMLPHKLGEDGYPKDNALRGSKTMLQCYDNSKLVNHSTITLRLKHYSKDSFQDYQFFVVETPTLERDHHRTPSECQVRSHPGSLCKNHAKTMSSIETDQTNNLSRVHNIDGKT